MEDTLVKNLNETIQYLRLQEDENRNLKDKISLLEAELSLLKEQTSYVLDEGNFHENIKTLPDGRFVILGINDLEKKNEEAVHDATNYFSKKCPYCERDLFKTNIRDKKEVDHFIPISKGGQNVPWNILPSCKGCNRKKRDKMPNVFLDEAIYDRCFKYLSVVKDYYEKEAIESYVNTYTLQKLIESNNRFIIRNSTESFIVDLMQLVYPKYLDNLNQIERSDPSLSVNSAKIFIRDHLIKGQSELDDAIRATHLYNIYKKWAKENKYEIVSQTKFGREMRNSKYENKRTSAGKVYVRVNVKAVGKVIASLQK